MPLTNFGYITDGDSGSGASIAYVDSQISEATANVVRNINVPDAQNINSIPVLTTADGRVLKRARITIDDSSPLGDVMSLQGIETKLSVTDILDTKELVSSVSNQIECLTSLKVDSGMTIGNVEYISSDAQWISLGGTLQAGTCYVICSQITVTEPYRITSVGENASIVGISRASKITYVGPDPTALFEFDDASFSIQRLTIKSTFGYVLRASNFDFNAQLFSGRFKTLHFIDVDFNSCYNGFIIEGFDTVTFTDCLLRFFQGESGVILRSSSKVDISNCQFIRWFNGDFIENPGVIPAESYSTASMVLFTSLSNAGAELAFGSVAVTGNIFHPQRTQRGIRIDNSTPMGVSSIAGNTFINVGLTTGTVTDYDISFHNGLRVDANSGIQNENAALQGLSVNNTTYSPTVSGIYTPVIYNNFSATKRTRFALTLANGQFTYVGLNPITLLVTSNILADQNEAKNSDCRFGLSVNGIVTNSIGILVEENKQRSFGFSCSVDIVTGDVLDFRCQNVTEGTTTQGFRVIDLSCAWSEV